VFDCDSWLLGEFSVVSSFSVVHLGQCPPPLSVAEVLCGEGPWKMDGASDGFVLACRVFVSFSPFFLILACGHIMDMQSRSVLCRIVDEFCGNV
jgi:hypothetical protein